MDYITCSGCLQIAKITAAEEISLPAVYSAVPSRKKIKPPHGQSY